MEATAQIIISGFAVLFGGGSLTFILRGMNSRIKGAVEKEVCGEKHKHVDADLKRGEKDFKEIKDDLKTINTTMADLNISVKVLIEKNGWNKTI